MLSPRKTELPQEVEASADQVARDAIPSYCSLYWSLPSLYTICEEIDVQREWLQCIAPAKSEMAAMMGTIAAGKWASLSRELYPHR